MAIGVVYQPFLDVARERGVDVDAVLAPLGLSYRALIEDNVRLVPDQGRALAAAVRGALPTTAESQEIGLTAAERFVASDADLLGYLLAHARSIAPAGPRGARRPAASMARPRCCPRKAGSACPRMPLVVTERSGSRVNVFAP